MFGELTLVVFKTSTSIENPIAYVQSIPDHQLSGLSFGTQLHGGYGTLNVELMIGRRRAAMIFDGLLGGHCYLIDGNGTRVYEGKINTTELTDGGMKLEANGYYSEASNLLHGGIYAAGTTSKTVLTDAIGLMSGYWQTITALIQDPDVLMPDLDFTNDEKVSDAIEAVCSYGYAEGDPRPIYFAIWNQRIPQIIRDPISYYSSYPEHAIDYYIRDINIGEQGVPVTRSLDSIFNKVYVRYDDTYNDNVGSTLIPTPAENTLSQGIYGVRETVIDGGKAGITFAQDLADMYVDQKAWPMQMLSIPVSGVGQLSSGMSVPLHMFRAGKTMKVIAGDLTIANTYPVANAGVGRSAIGLIVETSYSHDNREVTLTMGTRERQFDTLIAQLSVLE